MLRKVCIALAVASIASQAFAQTPNFGYSVRTTTDELIAINMTSRRMTTIGPVGFAEVSGLAFHHDGTLYGIDDTTDQLIRIDRRTGAGTAVGALGVNALDTGLTCDGNGILWMTTLTSNQIYQVDPLTGAAIPAGDSPGTAYGLTAIGDQFWALGASEFLRVEKGKADVIGSLGLPSPLTSGGVAVDWRGAFYAVDETGRLFLLNPATGEAGFVTMLVSGLESLAIPHHASCAYAVDGLDTDRLWLVDLTTGHPLLVGTPGFAEITGLAYRASDEMLFGVDGATDQLLTFDQTTGVATAVGALGVDVTSVGLVFDGSETLWMSSSSPAQLYTVNPATGAATPVGAGLSHSVCGLAFDGANMFGLADVTDELVAIDTNLGTSTTIGPLTNTTAAFGDLGFDAWGTLFGVNPLDRIFLASTNDGVAIEAAEVITGLTALAPIPCRYGDMELVLEKVQATIDWRTTGNDRLKLVGRIHPGGMTPNLAGVEVVITIDGNALTTAEILDENGTFRSERGAEPYVKYSLDPNTGRFAFDLASVDLQTHTPWIGNATYEGAYFLTVDVFIAGSGLYRPVRWARIPVAFRSKLGKKFQGKFQFKKTAPSVGLLEASSVRADEEATGHGITIDGWITANAGGPLEPVDEPLEAGDVRIRIGSASYDVPFASLVVTEKKGQKRYTYQGTAVPGLVDFVIDNAKRTFSLSTTETTGTGIPTAGPGESTTASFPFEMDVETARGVVHFGTRLEVLRSSASSTRWKR